MSCRHRHMLSSSASGGALLAGTFLCCGLLLSAGVVNGGCRGSCCGGRNLGEAAIVPGVGGGTPDAGIGGAGAGLPPERWRELPPTRPTQRELPAHEPPLSEPRTLGVKTRPPPPPRPPPRRLRRRLALMVLRWKQGNRSGAMRLAGEILSTPGLRTREMSALASLACVGCSLLAIEAMGRRISAQSWSWAQARWLLPLAAHASERVRLAVIRSFAWARVDLSAKRARRRLETFLWVFRHMATDPSPRVRAEAVGLLGRMKDRSAHRLLLAVSRDPYPVVRLAALDAMAEAVGFPPSASSTRRLCELLEDPSPTVRFAALEALPRHRAPCGLARIAGLLGDRSLAGLRLATDGAGAQGLRGPRGEVREAAYRALPPAFRATVPARAPWDLKVAAASAALLRLRPGLLSAARWSLRPMRPLPASAVRPSSERVALLEALDAPMRGALLVAVLGLLAHRAPRVRLAALARLALYAVDDSRGPVLSRALWLAKKDPHPLVRRAALSLLVGWHRGEAVRSRLLGSLGDPHPAVRLLAVELALDVYPRRAGSILLRRLAREVPQVRARLLSLMIPLNIRPAARDVARYLDEVASDKLMVPLGKEKRALGGAYGTVRGAVLSGLERAFGRRHRGPERRRARRWQDDLLRLGWDLGSATTR